ncbi:MAG: xanthine dehydrogenase small subunit, partial [Rhodospirillaceae bacterium]
MIRFVLNGALHAVAADVAPSTTMLDYVRDRLRLTGTKEGCAEGDCGACTVVRVFGDGRCEAVNACLMQVGQADGYEILTVEGLSADGGGLMPVQEAMAAGDGTQCGFCTPGFIGALYALQQSGETVDDPTIHDALAGNLCRCTGYRPIVEAARAACRTAMPRVAIPAPEAGECHSVPGQSFHAPRSLADLLALRTSHPDAMLLAGGTDLGLRVSKGRERPATVIHTARVPELQELAETPDSLTVGAGVTYARALPFIDRLFPSFGVLVRRIGSRQIRNLGTIGGNIGNASPIGDTPPCLIALGAELLLASSRGERKMPVEDFFLDYRKTALGAGEVIRAIRIPKLSDGRAFRAYKVSKRYDQDISSVIGAFRLDIGDGCVAGASIAFGGMAATPKRARAAEAALAGAAWSEYAL